MENIQIVPFANEKCKTLKVKHALLGVCDKKIKEIVQTSRS